MSVQPSPSGKPTIVLAHGAFADSASWNGVVSGLLAEGYPVLAAAIPLRGVRNDADYLASVVAGIEGDVVLVGHSYGGAVITNAATGNDRVRALVFVDGFAPDLGESAAELAERYEGGTLGETLVGFPLADGDTDLYIRPDRYHAQFAADSSAEDAAVMAATQRPIAESALNEPSGEPAWKHLPSWFLFGSEDKNIPPAALRFMAERARSRRTVELPGGSHTVAIPEAPEVVKLIHEAASFNATSAEAA